MATMTLPEGANEEKEAAIPLQTSKHPSPDRVYA